jgi:hypothetical protein
MTTFNTQIRTNKVPKVFNRPTITQIFLHNYRVEEKECGRWHKYDVHINGRYRFTMAVRKNNRFHDVFFSSNEERSYSKKIIKDHPEYVKAALDCLEHSNPWELRGSFAITFYVGYNNAPIHKARQGKR